MKGYSFAVPMRWMVLSIPVCLLPWARASADPFRCEHRTDAPVPALVCHDTGDAQKGHSAWVALRKMPAWGTHAGLTIVDFCLKENSVSPMDGDPLVVVRDDSEGQVPLASASCKRRYCTDKKKAFEFLINSVPFPVGWATVSFKLGLQTQSFSISCDEFSESIALQEGDLHS